MSKVLLALSLAVMLGVVAPRVAAQEEGAPAPESPVIEPVEGEGGDGTVTPGETGGDLDSEAREPGGEQRVTEKLATQFGVETEQVADLRNEGLGYGEIHHALSLANTMPGGATAENVDAVMEMRQNQNMGWGQIANEMGTTLGSAGKQPVAPIVTDPAGTGAPVGSTESPVMHGKSGMTHGNAGQSSGHGLGAGAVTGGGAHGAGAMGGGGLGHGGGMGGGGSRGNSGNAPGHNR